jgi:hypothetical protein
MEEAKMASLAWIGVRVANQLPMRRSLIVEEEGESRGR